MGADVSVWEGSTFLSNAARLADRRRSTSAAILMRVACALFDLLGLLGYILLTSHLITVLLYIL